MLYRYRLYLEDERTGELLEADDDELEADEI